MAWFFAQEGISGDEYLITGEDARHIEKSLRMKVGEELLLADTDDKEHSCIIEEISASGVRVKVQSTRPCLQEADVKVTLYQALTKGDKMDLIVQKAVELGVHGIVPVITARCVSRPDEKSLRKKVERWQKISLSAAQQSCRGIVPQVAEAISFKEALKRSEGADRRIIFYEGGGEKLSAILGGSVREVAIFIGPEGGFELSEVKDATESGVVRATLGKRILRAETAPLAALSAIMCLTGNMD